MMYIICHFVLIRDLKIVPETFSRNLRLTRSSRHLENTRVHFEKKFWRTTIELHFFSNPIILVWCSVQAFSIFRHFNATLRAYYFQLCNCAWELRFALMCWSKEAIQLTALNESIQIMCSLLIHDFSLLLKYGQLPLNIIHYKTSDTKPDDKTLFKLYNVLYYYFPV